MVNSERVHMSLYLLVMKTESIAHTYLIENARVEIGRAESATIRLNDPAVSRNHARLIISTAALQGTPSSKGAAEVTDTGSSYGIWVDDEQKFYEKISMGQVFRVSDQTALCLSYHPERIETSLAADLFSAESPDTSEQTIVEDSSEPVTLIKLAEESASTDVLDFSDPELMNSTVSTEVHTDESHADLTTDNQTESALGIPQKQVFNTTIKTPNIIVKPSTLARPKSSDPILNKTASHFFPQLTVTQNALLSDMSQRLEMLREILPVGVTASVQVREALSQIESLRTLIDPTPIPFGQAVTEVRQAVAPLTPADFAFHINDQTQNLTVTRSFIEAFKVAFLSVISADEVDWLHVDFFWEEGKLRVTSDPPLTYYLDPHRWEEQLALELLGLR